MTAINPWITPGDVERLKNAVLWAGGLEDAERAQLRAMLDAWQRREAELERARLEGFADGLKSPLRESQGG